MPSACPEAIQSLAENCAKLSLKNSCKKWSYQFNWRKSGNESKLNLFKISILFWCVSYFFCWDKNLTTPTTSLEPPALQLRPSGGSHIDEPPQPPNTFGSGPPGGLIDAESQKPTQTQHLPGFACKACVLDLLQRPRKNPKAFFFKAQNKKSPEVRKTRKTIGIPLKIT